MGWLFGPSQVEIDARKAVHRDKVKARKKAIQAKETERKALAAKAGRIAVGLWKTG